MYVCMYRLSYERRGDISFIARETDIKSVKISSIFVDMSKTCKNTVSNILNKLYSEIAISK